MVTCGALAPGAGGEEKEFLECRGLRVKKKGPAFNRSFIVEGLFLFGGFILLVSFS